ncbi:MAG TPA: biopolymer transporter ExbD [Candidatus Wallbacteria bacterium]|nr:biopolymer transporter ExbD [Candidatus Wallbacteria bacterium]
MSLNFRKPKKLRAEINMINLIDILFMINIFLLITTTFNTTASAIDVSLPKTSQAKTIKSETPGNLEVKIDREEKIYLNGNRITPDKLRDAFAEKQLLSQKSNLLLSADATCSHGKVVEVLDLAKKYGIVNLNIATQNVSGEKYEKNARAMAN